MKAKCILALFLCSLSSILPVKADTDTAPNFKNDYQSALAESKKSGKPLILIFSASWCPPCEQMKRSVYPSKEVQPFHKSFVWAYLDTDDPANRQAMAAYGVNGIPHIEFLQPGGQAIGHFSGAVSPNQFTQILTQVLEGPKKPQGSTRKRPHGSGTR